MLWEKVDLMSRSVGPGLGKYGVINGDSIDITGKILNYYLIVTVYNG